MLQPSRYTLSTALEWSYGGVNSSIPGNGGPECASFLSIERRIFESIVASTLSIFYTWWGLRCLSMPPTLQFVRKDRGGKRLLLVIVSMVFGMEIGFKFASKQLIYLLNPCHITTALQIYLLAAPPSRFVTVMFRVHLNYLNGAILAILFPVTNTRVLPFEEELYWLQHLLMLVTPYYLLRLGGVYTIEDLTDMSWTFLSTGVIFLYHFLPLQAIGLMSEVNLNNMLCPAISDPFYGPNYRLYALVHQSLCIPLVAKTFCLIATFFITTFPLTKIKDVLGSDVSFSAYESRARNGVHHLGSCSEPSLSTTNGGGTINGTTGSAVAVPPRRKSVGATSDTAAAAPGGGSSSPRDAIKDQPKRVSQPLMCSLVNDKAQLECTEEFLVTEGYEICYDEFGNAKEFVANHEHFD